MNSQGKIRSSDFSANDFPGKEGHIWALSIRPNFSAKISEFSRSFPRKCSYHSWQFREFRNFSLNGKLPYYSLYCWFSHDVTKI